LRDPRKPAKKRPIPTREKKIVKILDKRIKAPKRRLMVGTKFGKKNFKGGGIEDNSQVKPFLKTFLEKG